MQFNLYLIKDLGKACRAAPPGGLAGKKAQTLPGIGERPETGSRCYNSSSMVQEEIRQILPNDVTVIAIDGPSAAGKTVIGRELARRLGFSYLDTGLMYRAVGWLARQRNISLDNPSALGTLARTAPLRWEGREYDQVQIGGQRLGHELSDPEVSHWASVVATVPAVRRAMVLLQQSIARRGSIVMVGRDIGTVVAPDADLKIFMTASVEERARRRYRDLAGLGREVDYSQVLQETQERDDRDSTRTDSPLVPAEDAITINTDDLGIGQAVDAILQHLKLKVKK